MIWQSGSTDVTTDPETLVGTTYTKTSTSITAHITLPTATPGKWGIEIRNDADVVIRRQQVNQAGPLDVDDIVTVTVTGLAGGTTYHCQAYVDSTSRATV